MNISLRRYLVVLSLLVGSAIPCAANAYNFVEGFNESQKEKSYKSSEYFIGQLNNRFSSLERELQQQDRDNTQHLNEVVKMIDNMINQLIDIM